MWEVARFEVFWDVAPCDDVVGYQRFGGPWCLDLQGWSCWCNIFCHLILQLDGEAVQGQEFSASATLKNPLPSSLKKAQFIIEGPGLTSQLKIKLPQ